MEDLINLIGQVRYNITDSKTIQYSPVSKSLVANLSDVSHEEMKTVLQRLRHPLKAGESIDHPAETSIGELIQNTLDSSTTVEFHETPLEAAIDELSRQHQIPILIDYQGLSDAGIERDEPITIRLKNISLRNVLKLMLDPLEITYIVRNETIGLVTSNLEAAFSNFVVCAYDVGDIVHCEAPASYKPRIMFGLGSLSLTESQRWADAAPAALELIRLVERVPTFWTGFVEGPAGSVYYFSPTQSIVVLAPPSDQRLVARLFANLRNAHPQAPIDLFAPIGVEVKTNARLNRALRQPANTHINDLPLSEALLAISQQYSLNIVVDTMAFDETKNPYDLRLNGKLAGTTLGHALRELLALVNLSYRIEDEVVKVIPAPFTTARMHSLEGVDVESAWLFWNTSSLKGVESFSHRTSMGFGSSYWYGLLELFEPSESQDLEIWERWSEPDIFVFWPSNSLPIACETSAMGKQHSLFVRHTNRCQLEMSELLACLRERRSRTNNTTERLHNWEVYPLPHGHRKSGAPAKLVKRLRKEIASSSWKLASVQPIRCINGCLVIRQTSEVHQEIHRWLTNEFKRLQDVDL